MAVIRETTRTITKEVELSPLDLRRFQGILPPRAWGVVAGAMERAGDVLDGRVLWNVNSTPKGGGVAELLQSMVPYVRGAGVDARWVVIGGNPRFFAVTKRIHNRLHGVGVCGMPLGDDERRVYEETLQPNAAELASRIGAEDVVILHDPQTAGMIDALLDTGATILWRAHVGLDHPNDEARSAWNFLRGYVDGAHCYVFSRRAFAWEDLDESKIEIIPPSIDAFSPKNQDLDPDRVSAILSAAGIIEDGGSAEPLYQGVDGRFGSVQRRARFVGDNGPIPRDARLALQVSRWDRLKDPLGVIEGFARHFDGSSHLAVAGPETEAVADDPEGKEVLEEAEALWSSLPPQVRERVHLLALPMDDMQENAAIVNALQRRADVVVQKSLAEGFGLTVAEAMWKARPVIASRIGGIQDQIEHGVTGFLLDDPRDLDTFGRMLASLLDDPQRCTAVGRAARERVRAGFLHTTHLVRYLDLLERLLGSGARR